MTITIIFCDSIFQHTKWAFCIAYVIGLIGKVFAYRNPMNALYIPLTTAMTFNKSLSKSKYLDDY